LGKSLKTSNQNKIELCKDINSILNKPFSALKDRSIAFIFCKGKLLGMSTPLSLINIFDLEIGENQIKMLITWEQYLPERKRTDILSVEIEAENIFWENIPSLFDASSNSRQMAKKIEY
jgi:hypothetical protein